MSRGKGNDLIQLWSRGRKTCGASRGSADSVAYQRDPPIRHAGGIVGIDIVDNGGVVNQRSASGCLRLQNAVGVSLALLNINDREGGIGEDRNPINPESCSNDHR